MGAGSPTGAAGYTGATGQPVSILGERKRPSKSMAARVLPLTVQAYLRKIGSVSSLISH